MESVNNSAATISANINSIPLLNGTNFKEWKENVMIVLGCMDLDLALRTEKPATLKDTSTLDEKREMERWERSNRMSLMIMKHTIPESFRGTMSNEPDAKSFLAELEKRFAKNEKAETSTLLSTLVIMKYKGKGNIREYILEMSHIASKLSALKLILPEELLVYLVWISLPSQFTQFKVSYKIRLKVLIWHLPLRAARKGKLRKLQIQGLPESIIRKLSKKLRNMDASFAKGLITRKRTALSTTPGCEKGVA
ncbi:unnamed protein product [Cuscuta europaea]|uniref:Retrotransposon Copia-like N-terminal domain-containing protein n=1 Tax=Cuscuta europaea TaxID=41803 RepID=A0A9P0ZF24_CUSEU|nr:unnamed protein product [Cuscuta europaea]